MSRGIDRTGMQRIAEAAARQRHRQAARDAALEPVVLRYATLEDVAKDFDRQPDGQLVDRQAHRVWQIRSAPEGGFEIIRAQDENIDKSEQPEQGMPVAAAERHGLTAGLLKAASRGAQFVPSAPMEAQAPMEQPMPQVGGAGQCGDCGATGLSMTSGCPQCGSPNVVEAQAAPPAPPAMPAPTAQAPAPTPAAPPMIASTREIVQQPGEQRLAGIGRGAKVLVRLGRKAVLAGKVLVRTATYFDILLENGATTRVLPRDVAPDRPNKQPAVGTRPKAAAAPQPTAMPRTAVDEKAKEYWSTYWKEYGRQLVKTDFPRSVTDHAEPATPENKQETPTKKESAAVRQGDYVDIGNIWMAAPPMRTSVVKVLAADSAQLKVEDPFGASMTVPRAAVVGGRTAEEFRYIRSKGTRASKLLQVAAGALTWSQLQSRYAHSAVQIETVRRSIAEGIRIGVAGGDVETRDGAAYEARYKAQRAAGKDPAVARHLAMEECPGCWGKVSAMQEFDDPLVRGLDRQAIDEKAKKYYAAYWGPYGEDLVKEIKRRVRADIIERSAGRQKKPDAIASALKFAVPQVGQTVATLKGPIEIPRGAQVEFTTMPSATETVSLTTKANPQRPNREAQIAKAIELHVAGILKSSFHDAKARNYTIDPTSVRVEAREGDVVRGQYTGAYTEDGRTIQATRRFEIQVQGGVVKAVKIEA